MAYLGVPVTNSIHRPKFGVGLYASIYGNQFERFIYEDIPVQIYLIALGLNK